MPILKLKGSAVAVTTANTVSNAKLVRIHATNAATITVTNVDDSGNTVAGTFNMSIGQVEYLEKDPEDTIAASAAVSCTPISYRT